MKMKAQFLEQFYRLDQPGILVINKQLYNSSNMLSTLKRVGRVKKVVILESGITNPVIRSIKAGCYSQKLQIKGHTRPWKTSIQVRLYNKAQHANVGDYKAFVVLHNTYSELVVGVFDNKAAAKAFIKEFYPKGIKSIVMASNKLTKAYNEDS